MYIRESSSSTVLLADTEVLVVVEDVIWDAATAVIMIMITVRISYSSFLLSTSILPRYTYFS